MAKKEWFPDKALIDQVDIVFGTYDLTPAQRKADDKQMAIIMAEYRRTGKIPKYTPAKTKAKKAKSTSRKTKV